MSNVWPPSEKLTVMRFVKVWTDSCVWTVIQSNVLEILIKSKPIVPLLVHRISFFYLLTGTRFWEIFLLLNNFFHWSFGFLSQKEAVPEQDTSRVTSTCNRKMPFGIYWSPQWDILSTYRDKLGKSIVFALLWIVQLQRSLLARRCKEVRLLKFLSQSSIKFGSLLWNGSSRCLNMDNETVLQFQNWPKITCVCPMRGWQNGSIRNLKTL